MAAKTDKKPSKSGKTGAGTAAKGKTPRPNDLPEADMLKQLYRNMLMIRRFEEKAGQLYGMGLIGGFCHLYIGQEAVVTGIQSVLSEQDTVITAYRDHGHMLATGMDPKGVMAELTGRIDGYSKGKGGSMHMFSRDKGFYGGHGIVGASTSLGTGLGFAHRYTGDGGICATYLGDGAVNQGQTAESYNLASLWNLPVLYVVENNQYGMGTSVARHAAGDLYKRGESFGIPGERVDGMDVLAVRSAAEEAVKYVRDNSRPMILEVMTYRYRGHSMSDPAKYRTKEELSSYKDERDPISQFKQIMIEQGEIPEDDIKSIDKKIKSIINEAAEFAQQSPEPDAEEMWTDILVPVQE